MKYLFLFTLGPVQSFIAQARKTQDFYSGSKLLSDLVDKAIRFTQENCKSEIIFPDKSVKSKPNRFLAEIEADNDGEMKNLGNQIEEFVREEFTTIANNVLKKYPKPDNFEKQIGQFLEIYWVAKPLNDAEYNKNYESIERLLGSVKNIRKFNQLGEKGRKCSLCGERNVLFYKGIAEKYKKRAFIQDDAVEIRNDFKLNTREGLCAVCFTKRFFETENFPSTAEIALLYKINHLKDIDDQHKIDNMLTKNYQLAYEENITHEFFRKNDITMDVKEALSLQGVLKDNAKIKNLKLSKYYAMIMFDGDSMGKWLSGKYLNKDADLKAYHSEFSKLLGEYANWASKYIDGQNEDKVQKGKTVYAGGDDFLGFINLQYLFSALKELREKYSEIVNNGLKEYKKDNGNLSFSAGIVIAHYKTPLGEVLNWARKMEKEAKNIDDNKNAFSLAVLKHSGEINKTRYKWYDKNGFVPSNMSIIVKGLKNEEFSNNYIKVLNQEFEKLIDKDNMLGLDDKIIKTEVKRLVNKSYTGRKEDKGVKTKRICDLLFELIEERRNYRNFLFFLNIADFIAREMPAKLEENLS